MMPSNGAATRTLPRLSAHDSQFATVLVGSDKKRFIVHQDLLTYHSTFFQAALTGRFKEAKTKTVTLPEDDPRDFEFFVHWLYHKQLPTEENAPKELLEQWSRKDDEGKTKTGNLIWLYVLAEKFNIPKLKTETLDELFNDLCVLNVDLPSTNQIKYAFDNLPEDLALLRLLVSNQCIFSDEDFWSNTNIDDYPSAFLAKVVAYYAGYAMGTREWDEEMQLCEFHDHEDGKSKRACPSKGKRAHIFS